MQRRMLIPLVALAIGAVLALAFPISAAPAQNKGPKNKGTISGLVVDANNDPVGGASVLLFDGVAIDQIAETFTNSSGEFTFTRLSPGGYSITALALCCGVGNASVTVTGGQTTSVTIQLN